MWGGSHSLMNEKVQENLSLLSTRLGGFKLKIKIYHFQDTNIGDSKFNRTQQ